MTRILLCEPQEDLAIAMREFLTSQQYAVDLESNGRRVLACIQEIQFDAIILEIALPDLGGLEIIQQYRSAGGNTAILLLTGRVSSAEQKHITEIGADACLAKPFRLDQLAQNLTAVLQENRLKTSKQTPSE